jgi:hypothetical protein
MRPGARQPTNGWPEWIFAALILLSALGHAYRLITTGQIGQLVVQIIVVAVLIGTIVLMMQYLGGGHSA